MIATGFALVGLCALLFGWLWVLSVKGPEALGALGFYGFFILPFGLSCLVCAVVAWFASGHWIEIH